MSASVFKHDLPEDPARADLAEVTVLRLQDPEPADTDDSIRADAPVRLAEAAPTSAAATPTAPRTEPWWLRRGTPPYLLMCDVLAFTLAMLATSPMSVFHLVSVTVNVAVFSLAGLYRSRLNLTLLNDVPYILAAVVVSFALQTTLISLVTQPRLPAAQINHALVLVATVVAFRWLAYAVVRYGRRCGKVSHRTVILGTGQVGTHLALTLLERREYGLDPVGFVETTPSVSDASLIPLPIIGGYEQLESVIKEHSIRDVIVAFGSADESDLVDILTTCDRIDVEVFLVPRLLEVRHARRDTDDIWGVSVLRRRPATFRSLSWKVKRGVDVLLSTVALIMLSPVLLICALAVRLEGGPGVIFRQQRVGMDGRAFDILKFRTMKPVNDLESRTNWNIRNDDRIGKVGRLLRSSSLDELPQLWNILRGDMSLVGPRPERQHFVDQFSTHIPRYTARHRVPAGLTGWSQAHGLRGDTSIYDRARFDNYYIENWSLWLDVKILLLTVGQVLRRAGG